MKYCKVIIIICILCGCRNSPKIAEIIANKDYRALSAYLDSGGDPNLKFEIGGNPKMRESLLSYAARKADVEICSLLIKSGANPAARDDLNEIPLVTILRRRDVTSRFTIVELLIKYIKEYGAEDIEIIERALVRYGTEKERRTWNLYAQKKIQVHSPH